MYSMNIEPNSHSLTENDLHPNNLDNLSKNISITDKIAAKCSLEPISILRGQNINLINVIPRALPLIAITIITTITGMIIDNFFLGITGIIATLLLSLIILLPWLKNFAVEWPSVHEWMLTFGLVGIVISTIGLLKFTGIGQLLIIGGRKVNWEASGTIAEWVGAFGQILIAIIAVYIAWRQYIISKDLTIQQNLLTAQQNIITQQQTIDSYFQGISDLVLDEGGLLEDLPQERLLAEGRTSAILSSVNSSGKSKILRFLSRSKLLTPLKRDGHLGRAILDGTGGYAEDRVRGVKVIDLGVMLAGADLSETDLRWTDLSDANLVRANLSCCDLVRANLSRTILYETNLKGSDINGTHLFYGSPKTASPRNKTEIPNYQTVEYTGAVVENADFSSVRRMSENARYYCCAWGGEKTRGTIPGGCEGIPNCLGK